MTKVSYEEFVSKNSANNLGLAKIALNHSIKGKRPKYSLQSLSVSYYSVLRLSISEALDDAKVTRIEDK